MSPEEARRDGLHQARRYRTRQGGSRDTPLGNSLRQFLPRFPLRLRNLRKDRRFSLIAIFALALGIGASTVVFSVVLQRVFQRPSL